jgi:hypothetical protein
VAISKTISAYITFYVVVLTFHIHLMILISVCNIVLDFLFRTYFLDAL